MKYELLFVNTACLSKHQQRLPLGSAFSTALYPWLAHYCQRFDVPPALSFVGHDGDSVSTLQSQNSAQCEGTPKFIKGIICIWVPDTSVPPDFTLDLGFIRSHRDGKQRFRSSAPPDGAERVGSQCRVSDGARRPRLHAAPRSLPAREILLIPPLHGSALRSVLNAALFLCMEEK